MKKRLTRMARLMSERPTMMKEGVHSLGVVHVSTVLTVDQKIRRARKSDTNEMTFQSIR